MQVYRACEKSIQLFQNRPQQILIHTIELHAI